MENQNWTKECDCMNKMKGIAILLFAILLQLSSTGMELLTLGIGVVGLIIAIIDDSKRE